MWSPSSPRVPLVPGDAGLGLVEQPVGLAGGLADEVLRVAHHFVDGLEARHDGEGRVVRLLDHGLQLPRTTLLKRETSTSSWLTSSPATTPASILAWVSAFAFIAPNIQSRYSATDTKRCAACK